ncbi:MAG: hypothetical protein JXB38_17115 [Anaerolineales bacterium]|nr:hypothetical protein [Anaerolineales bacterium]
MKNTAFPYPGLCQTCQHARRIQSVHGSVFWLCGAHKQNPGLPKYPRLPVLHCLTHAPNEPQIMEDDE